MRPAATASLNSKANEHDRMITEKPCWLCTHSSLSLSLVPSSLYLAGLSLTVSSAGYCGFMPSGYCDKTCAFCHSSNSTTNLLSGSSLVDLPSKKGALPNVPTQRRASTSPAPSAAPTNRPTTNPTVTAPPSFAPTRNLVTLTSGECSAVGSCITTPNFPNRYPSDTECTWRTSASNVSAVLSVTTFDLESGYDLLSITGPGSTIQSFSGNEGPEGAVVGPGEVITFTSDFGMEYSGFEICFVSCHV